MTNTELQRHELRNKLAEVLGDAAMETLMGHLPPSGWADVARKDDIDVLRREMHVEIEGLRRDMGQLEARLETKIDIRIEQLRTEMYKGFADVMRSMNKQLITFTTVQFTLTTLLAGVILKFG